MRGARGRNLDQIRDAAETAEMVEAQGGDEIVRVGDDAQHPGARARGLAHPPTLVQLALRIAAGLDDEPGKDADE